MAIDRVAEWIKGISTESDNDGVIRSGNVVELHSLMRWIGLSTIKWNRCLKRIGLSFNDANGIAAISTVKTGSSFALPYGFVQSLCIQPEEIKDVYMNQL
jgi:hypothetical protein